METARTRPLHRVCGPESGAGGRHQRPPRREPAAPAVNSSAFSPEGQRLLTASEDGGVYGWETQSRRLLWRLSSHTGHQRSVGTVSFSPDSKQLASGGWDKQVMLWEVQATGSCDSTISIWDLRMVTPVIFHQELEGHSGNISCLCYSASGLLVKVWDCNTGKYNEALKGVLDVAHACAFTPDGKLLVSMELLIRQDTKSTA